MRIACLQFIHRISLPLLPPPTLLPFPLLLHVAQVVVTIRNLPLGFDAARWVSSHLSASITKGGP